MSDRIRQRIPLDHSPSFPARCIGCGLGHPGASERFGGRAFHPAHLILLFFLGRRVDYQVPVCWDCQEFHQRRRGQLRLAVAVALVGAALLILLVLPLLPANGKQLLIVGVLGLCLAPPILWKALAPPALEVTVEPEHVLLEFRSAELADEFAALNRPGEDAAPEDSRGVADPRTRPGSVRGPSGTRG